MRDLVRAYGADPGGEQREPVGRVAREPGQRLRLRTEERHAAQHRGLEDGADRGARGPGLDPSHGARRASEAVGELGDRPAALAASGRDEGTERGERGAGLRLKVEGAFHTSMRL